MFLPQVHSAAASGGAVTTDVTTDREGNQVLIPLLVTGGCVLAATVLYHISKLALYLAMQRNSEGDNDLREDRDFMVNGKVVAVDCVCVCV